MMISAVAVSTTRYCSSIIGIAPWSTKLTTICWILMILVLVVATTVMGIWILGVVSLISLVVHGLSFILLFVTPSTTTWIWIVLWTLVVASTVVISSVIVGIRIVVRTCRTTSWGVAPTTLCTSSIMSVAFIIAIIFILSALSSAIAMLIIILSIRLLLCRWLALISIVHITWWIIVSSTSTVLPMRCIGLPSEVCLGLESALSVLTLVILVAVINCAFALEFVSVVIVCRILSVVILIVSICWILPW